VNRNAGEAPMHLVSTVRLVQGRAEVRVGDQRLDVARRDVKHPNGLCPVELIAGALGS